MADQELVFRLRAEDENLTRTFRTAQQEAERTGASYLKLADTTLRINAETGRLRDAISRNWGDIRNATDAIGGTFEDAFRTFGLPPERVQEFETNVARIQDAIGALRERPDFSPASDELAQLQAALEDFRGDVEDDPGFLGLTPRAVADFQRRADIVRDEIDRLQSQQATLTAFLQTVEPDTPLFAVTTRAIAQLRRQLVELGSEFREQFGAIDLVAQQEQRLADAGITTTRAIEEQVQQLASLREDAAGAAETVGQLAERERGLIRTQLDLNTATADTVQRFAELGLAVRDADFQSSANRAAALRAEIQLLEQSIEELSQERADVPVGEFDETSAKINFTRQRIAGLREELESLEASFRDAGRSSAPLQDAEQRLRSASIATTQSLRDQQEELAELRVAAQGDVAAIAQLEERERRLLQTMEALGVATTDDAQRLRQLEQASLVAADGLSELARFGIITTEQFEEQIALLQRIRETAVDPAVAGQAAEAQAILVRRLQESSAAAQINQKTTNEAAFALQNFSFITQDAAQFGLGFNAGLRAIANNLDSVLRTTVRVKQGLDQQNISFSQFLSLAKSSPTILLLFGTVLLNVFTSALQIIGELTKDTEKLEDAATEAGAELVEVTESFTRLQVTGSARTGELVEDVREVRDELKGIIAIQDLLTRPTVPLGPGFARQVPVLEELNDEALRNLGIFKNIAESQAEFESRLGRSATQVDALGETIRLAGDAFDGLLEDLEEQERRQKALNAVTEALLLRYGEAGVSVLRFEARLSEANREAKDLAITLTGLQNVGDTKFEVVVEALETEALAEVLDTVREINELNALIGENPLIIEAQGAVDELLEIAELERDIIALRGQTAAGRARLGLLEQELEILEAIAEADRDRGRTAAGDLELERERDRLLAQQFARLTSIEGIEAAQLAARSDQFERLIELTRRQAALQSEAVLQARFVNDQKEREIDAEETLDSLLRQRAAIETGPGQDLELIERRVGIESRVNDVLIARLALADAETQQLEAQTERDERRVAFAEELAALRRIRPVDVAEQLAEEVALLEERNRLAADELRTLSTTETGRRLSIGLLQEEIDEQQRSLVLLQQQNVVLEQQADLRSRLAVGAFREELEQLRRRNLLEEERLAILATDDGFEDFRIEQERAREIDRQNRLLELQTVTRADALRDVQFETSELEEQNRIARERLSVLEDTTVAQGLVRAQQDQETVALREQVRLLGVRLNLIGAGPDVTSLVTLEAQRDILQAQIALQQGVAAATATAGAELFQQLAILQTQNAVAVAKLEIIEGTRSAEAAINALLEQRLITEEAAADLKERASGLTREQLRAELLVNQALRERVADAFRIDPGELGAIIDTDAFDAALRESGLTVDQWAETTRDRLSDTVFEFDQNFKRMSDIVATFRAQGSSDIEAWGQTLFTTAEGLAFLGEQAGAIFGNLAGAFRTLSDTADGEGRKQFETFKKLAIAEAIVNTLVAATLAYRQGGPILGIALAGSILALGFAQVAKIRSMQPGGSATAGTAGSIGAAPNFFGDLGFAQGGGRISPGGPGGSLPEGTVIPPPPDLSVDVTVDFGDAPGVTLSAPGEPVFTAPTLTLSIPELPELTAPALPTLSVEAPPPLQVEPVPPLVVGDVPQLDIETPPTLALAELPDLEVPDLPVLDVAPLPPLAVEAPPELQISTPPVLTVEAVPPLEITRPLPDVAIVTPAPIQVSVPDVVVPKLPALEVDEPGPVQVAAVSPIEVETPEELRVAEPPALTVDLPVIETQVPPRLEFGPIPRVEISAPPELEVADPPRLEITPVPPLTVEAPPDLQISAPPVLTIEAVAPLQIGPLPQLEVIAPDPIEIVEPPPVRIPDIPTLRVERPPVVSFAAAPPVEIPDVPELTIAEPPVLTVAAVPPLEVIAPPPLAVQVPRLSVAEPPQLTIETPPELRIAEPPLLTVRDPGPLPVVDVDPIPVAPTDPIQVDQPTQLVVEPPELPVLRVAPLPVLAAPEIGELAAPVLPTLEVESIDPLQAPVLPPLEAPDVDPLEAPDLAPLRVEAIEFPEVRVPAIAVSAPELSVEAPVFAEPPSISVDAPEFLAVATPGPLPIDTTEFLRPRDRFGDIFGPSPIGGVSQVDELEVRLLVDGEMVQEGRTLVSVLRAETTAQKIRGIRNPLNV